MEYFSLPLQAMMTGTVFIALVSMIRSITRTNRRIESFNADLLSLKTLFSAASAPVPDKLRVAPTTDVKVHQVGTAPHNAIVNVSSALDLQLAIEQLNASFEAVMTKLDRIETLVDTLPCKIPS